MQYLKYLWALPCTLIGFLLFLISIPRKIIKRDDMFIGMARKTWFLPKNIIAITFGNLVIYSSNFTLDARTITHESMHVKQYMRYGILFYLFYLIEFLIGYYKYHNWYQAYYNIGLEEEARKYAEIP